MVRQSDGFVENVIVADDSFEMEGYDLIDVGSDSVSPGYSRINGSWVKPREEDEREES